jgi:anthranilate phosphoribosyltransferase
MADLKSLVGRVANGKPLSREEAQEAFTLIMSGEGTPAQIGGFLMALRLRGETVDEIAGAVATMRAKMLPVQAPPDAMDVVGTGGDASGTHNISTGAAFIVAAAGVPVAKHGNRALSSKSGSADVLKALGVNIELTPEGIARCISEAGIGFMFAPAHHSAMKHVGPVRAELGTRTIFNLIGPLSNPAGVKRHLVGVYSAEWVRPVAEVLQALGSEKAWVVHGAGGVDEISPAGPTEVAELSNGRVRTFHVSPTDAGQEMMTIEMIRGGDAAFNAAALRGVFEGARGPLRDVLLLNAAGALVVAEKATDLSDGVVVAARLIDEGAALDRLERLVEVSNRPG